MGYPVHPRPLPIMRVCAKSPEEAALLIDAALETNDIPPELMTEEELAREIDKLNCKPLPPDNVLIGRGFSPRRSVSGGTPVRK